MKETDANAASEAETYRRDQDRFFRQLKEEVEFRASAAEERREAEERAQQEAMRARSELIKNLMRAGYSEDQVTKLMDKIDKISEPF